MLRLQSLRGCLACVYKFEVKIFCCEVKKLFSKIKKKLKVDLGRLKVETESLSTFLRLNLGACITSRGNKLWMDSEISPQKS